MTSSTNTVPAFAKYELAPHRRNMSILYPIVFILLLTISRYIFPNKMTLFIEVGIFAIYVMGNNVLMGYLGLVSFGQPFYLSVGAYSAALYLAHVGSNLYIAMVLSIVAGILLSIIFGPIFIRLRSSYFTLINAALCAMGLFNV